MNLEIGSKVEILEPFGEFFPDVYTVKGMDGSTIFLEEVESAFDTKFLKEAK